MSTFGAEKFTTRSREAIETAQLAATTAGHTQTEPIHLLAALLRDADGTARQLVGKAGADAASLAAQAEGALQALPKASGATVQQPAASPGPDPRARGRARPRGVDEGRLRRHRAPADQPGDRRVGREDPAHRRRPHRGRAARGADRPARQPPGHESRGGVDVREPREVLRRPDPGRRGREARPGDRPRRRDPPGDPGAVAAYQEQPGPDRRARASARPPSSRGSPSGSSPATCPTR